MIVVHHLENSRSLRILWMLEELGLDYEVKHYARNKKTQLAPPELLEMHPLGKSPVLEDNGVVVAETGAILEYLLAQYDKEGAFKPADPLSKEGMSYSYWLHSCEGSLMPFLVMTKVFQSIKQAPMPFFIKPVAKAIASKVEKSYIAPSLKRHFEYIESILCHQDWFAGEQFSAADVQMSFPLEAASKSMAGQYPYIESWLERIHTRPAWQAAHKKGGPYEFVK